MNKITNHENTTELQHDAKLPVMRCLDCEFIRKMKSGKDWCVNDKSWMVGWITDVKIQVCEHYVLRK